MATAEEWGKFIKAAEQAGPMPEHWRIVMDILAEAGEPLPLRGKPWTTVFRLRDGLVPIEYDAGGLIITPPRVAQVRTQQDFKSFQLAYNYLYWYGKAVAPEDFKTHLGPKSELTNLSACYDFLLELGTGRIRFLRPVVSDAPIQLTVPATTGPFTYQILANSIEPAQKD